MWAFLADLLRSPNTPHSVVVMDDGEVGDTRRYRVRPARLLWGWLGTLGVMALVAAALIAFTPLRTFIPGYGTEELRQNARLNAIRVAALKDSVAVQRQYIERLQQLITGEVDSSAQSTRPAPSPSREAPSAEPVAPDPSRGNAPPNEDDEGDHQQPALSMSALPAQDGSLQGNTPDDQSGLGLPVRPPVTTGFPTRRFDARDEHYGIDIAVPEGTTVRSVGAGYVVLADWTEGGGYTVAVQHANGYLSVYKHNQRLLKQIGDRVEAREALAVSGNTGAMTTGPHLHFELWRDGLAQDPRPYVIGW